MSGLLIAQIIFVLDPSLLIIVNAKVFESSSLLCLSDSCPNRLHQFVIHLLQIKIISLLMVCFCFLGCCVDLSLISNLTNPVVRVRASYFNSLC